MWWKSLWVLTLMVKKYLSYGAKTGLFELFNCLTINYIINQFILWTQDFSLFSDKSVFPHLLTICLLGYNDTGPGCPICIWGGGLICKGQCRFKWTDQKKKKRRRWELIWINSNNLWCGGQQASLSSLSSGEHPGDAVNPAASVVAALDKPECSFNGAIRDKCELQAPLPLLQIIEDHWIYQLQLDVTDSLYDFICLLIVFSSKFTVLVFVHNCVS